MVELLEGRDETRSTPRPRGITSSRGLLRRASLASRSLLPPRRLGRGGWRRWGPSPDRATTAAPGRGAKDRRSRPRDTTPYRVVKGFGFSDWWCAFSGRSRTLNQRTSEAVGYCPAVIPIQGLTFFVKTMAHFVANRCHIPGSITALGAPNGLPRADVPSSVLMDGVQIAPTSRPHFGGCGRSGAADETNHGRFEIDMNARLPLD